jgi:hypothetical protein
MARSCASQESIEAQRAKGAEHGGHMTVRKRARDEEHIGGRNQSLALEEAAQAVDLSWRSVREIGNGALENFGAIADGFAEQDGRRRVAIGNPLHVHGFIIEH